MLILIKNSFREMGKFFIYNSENTRDKKLLEVALDEGMSMHTIDINQGLEQQLVGYIGRIPIHHMAELLDERVVEKNGLDNNLDLIRFVEERPHIVKTPIMISQEDCVPVETAEDIRASEMVS